MNAIKKYEKLTMIIIKDWDPIFTTLSTAELAEKLTKSEFILIWDELISKYLIQRARPYKPDSIDQYILSQPKEIQEKIKIRKQQMYDRTWAVWESVEQVQKWVKENT